MRGGYWRGGLFPVLVLPLGAQGAVFQRDAFRCQAVADLVGQSELARGAQLGAHGYQQVDEWRRGQFRRGAGPLREGQAQHAAQLAQGSLPVVNALAGVPAPVDVPGQVEEGGHRLGACSGHRP